MTASHLNERSIELLILGSPEVADRREEMLRHVESCPQCRELYDEMREFYAAIDKDVEPARLPETSSLAIRPQYQRAVVRAPERGAVMRWVSRHRAATAGSTALVFGALAWLASTWVSAGGSPSYVNYNLPQNLVEVYNARNEKLWHLAVNDASVLRETLIREPLLSRVSVTDLDADGRTEVLIAAGSADPRLSPNQRLASFDASGSLRWMAGDLPPVEFRGTRYPEEFHVLYFAVLRSVPEKPAEVVAVLTNGRSPCAVVRYDAHGKILGEYWHFGNLVGPYPYDLDGDGVEELLFCGSNDADEAELGSPGVRPVVLALDPYKITGRTESSAAPGFGFAPSPAERAYLRMPQGSVDRTLGVGMRAARLRAADSSLIAFQVSTYPGELRVLFDLRLDRKLRVAGVMSTSDTEYLIRDLKRRGMLSRTVTGASVLREYEKVEYWTGSGWAREPGR